MRELRADVQGPCLRYEGNSRVESVYSVARGISGTPLMDSYHIGSTVINDYGRPFENGLNSYSGASGYASAGRFLIYVRGEFQGAPSGRVHRHLREGTHGDRRRCELPQHHQHDPVEPPGHHPVGPIEPQLMAGSWRPTSRASARPRSFLRQAG